MPAPFKKVSLDQFATILDRFQFTRTIDAVHMHHTWRPNHAQFKGHDSIVAMWRYHTQEKGWSDIAQHITIDPNGQIWLGRNWNSAPASALGRNGDRNAGPFMFEMIGDFDLGRDPFGGSQKDTALSVIALVQRRFGLPVESLWFHNMMSGKTCPGNSIDYQQTLREVRRQRARMDEVQLVLATMAAPFPPDTYAPDQDIEQALAALSWRGHEAYADVEGEVCSHHQVSAPDSQETARGRSAALTAEQLQGLRAHLVNLTMGEFSTDGQWRTSRADVDAIFSEHLPRALEAARRDRRPLRLMFQAHGGLNDEASGLAIAQKSVAWWQSNHIYPIYFAWETGLFETIIQQLRDVAGRRDLADFTSDPLIQEAVRLLPAPMIWGGMKQSAQMASQPGTGGAYYVAQQLAAFCKLHQDVELHAVGHSAGAVFHSWFIPCALALGTPQFRSLHLMAPAVRVDLFKEKLAALIGARRGVGELTVYTMKEDLEAADTCAGIYRKSLLYLIFHALEPRRKTPILGLEESLRADPDLNDLFGLNGAPADTTHASVVWSRTAASRGRSASQAMAHGAFDDDPATMGSIARRILNKADNDSINEYVHGAQPAAQSSEQRVVEPEHAPGAAAEAPGAKAQAKNGAIRTTGTRPSRRALCVGINAYPDRPLNGCVADSETWSRTLSSAGFTVTSLLDRQATRAGIVENLDNMIASSRSGDVLVFQYAGHGVFFGDDSGDELDGLREQNDEALCPIDYADGALLSDDDIALMFARLPQGVNLTCFMDCCHSGDLARAALATGRPDDPDARARFLPASAELIEAHRRFRAAGAAVQFNAAPGARSAHGPIGKPAVMFAACRSDQVAWESRGQGHFTARATTILNAAPPGMTNAEFGARVTAAFGEKARQETVIDSDETALTRLLLEPIGQTAVAPAAQAKTDADRTASAQSAPAQPEMAQVIHLLQSIEQLLHDQVQMQQHSADRRFKPKGKSAVQHSPPQSMQSSGPNR